jgi:DNA-binding CsgD family transcriptional regulator
MMIANDDRRYVGVNEAACRLLGLPADQIVGRRVDDLTTAAMRSQLPALWRQFLEEGSQTGPWELEKPDGEVVAVDYAATANVAPGFHLAIFLQPGGDDPTAGGSLEEDVVATSHGVLSSREREVLGRLARGESGQEISRGLGIASETVRNHVRSARQKLGARTRAHAIALAIRRGEIEL